MNIIECKVNDNNDMLVFEYVFENNLYNIEVPKTDNNKHLNDGDIIEAILGIEVPEGQLIPMDALQEIEELESLEKDNG